MNKDFNGRLQFCESPKTTEVTGVAKINFDLFTINYGELFITHRLIQVFSVMQRKVHFSIVIHGFPYSQISEW